MFSLLTKWKFSLCNHTEHICFLIKQNREQWHRDYSKALYVGSGSKESTCNVGDLGSIPGLGRSPGEGNSYPLQYSGLENSMNCIAHGVAKRQTRLSDFHLLLWLIILAHAKATLDLESFFPTGQHKGAPFKEKLSLV